jgi:chorismate synthase
LCLERAVVNINQNKLKLMNSFGQIFCISIFGESHGDGIGVILDGVPAGIGLSTADFEGDLSRRRSGASGTTPRREADLPKLMSGVYNGFTTGAPLAVFFENTNTKSGDYDNLRDVPRPGHADFTARAKYAGFTDPRGGGHFSGRITLGLVAAGVVAKKIIDPVSIRSEILEVGGETDIQKGLAKIENTGDSIGGIIQCVASGLPKGLGEPFFGSVESTLSHLVFSIPAIKGIEFGSGFAAARMRGSEHNDPIVSADGKTLTNNAAGINGGITNGNDIVFRVAVKPTSSIALPQQTMNMKTGKMETLQVVGRHDVCIALRVPVIVEAVTAIGLADLLLVHKSRS